MRVLTGIEVKNGGNRGRFQLLNEESSAWLESDDQAASLVVNGCLRKASLSSQPLPTKGP